MTDATLSDGETASEAMVMIAGAMLLGVTIACETVDVSAVFVCSAIWPAVVSATCMVRVVEAVLP